MAWAHPKGLLQQAIQEWPVMTHPVLGRGPAQLLAQCLAKVVTAL